MSCVFLIIALLTVVCASRSTAQQGALDDQALIKQLDIHNVDAMHGLTFEIYVCKLLGSQGYSAENMRASNDFGTDIIAVKGDDKVSVQVKRSKNPIDRNAISDAVAGMAYYKCNKSMVITNSRFTDAAREFASKTDCILVDREQLTKWIDAYRQTPMPTR